VRAVECPRCGKDLLPPSLLEYQYRCPVHGQVSGLRQPVPVSDTDVADLAKRSAVPIWFPRNLPEAWLLTGLRWAESPRRETVAVVLGISGKGLAQGPTDVLILAEQPGCGLGARYTGLATPDPDEECFGASPSSRVRTGHRSTGVWSLQAPTDRVAFVGEADGDWLWIIGWPDSAWSLLLDGLELVDARYDDSYKRFGVGAVNPRLKALG